jgi:hypothetical protein
VRYKVVGLNGNPCLRCGKPTQIREHTEITAKHLSQRLAEAASIPIDLARVHVRAVAIKPLPPRRPSQEY